MFKKLLMFWRMSISSFFIMLLMFFFIYVLQFFTFKNWILNHEKKNIKTILGQIELLINFDDIDYNQYIENFKLINVDFVIYDEYRQILSSNEQIREFLKNKQFPTQINIKFDDRIKKIILNGPINLNSYRAYVYMEKQIYLYEDFLGEIIPTIFISIFIIITVSLISGMYISKNFINELNFLKVTMRKVKEGGVSDRVEILNENDEFEEIGIIFNSMMDEVEKSFNLQRQFIQDASHELRTPLTILKGHLQMLNRWGKYDKDILDKSLKIALDETERFTKLVNDLLTLTNTENNVKFNKTDESINVCTVISDVIYSFNLLKADIKINFECEDGLYLKILQEHLKQLIIIFLDNSIKYCDKDKKIIDVKIYSENDTIVLSVKDNGIGIKKQDIEKVTDKFYRADKSRKYNNSFGIGLSIALHLVNLYNGKLKINSEFGVYTEVLVYFKK